MGCGPGRLTVALNERGIPALGVDISRAAVARVREAGLEATDVRGYEMPAERSFDIDTARDLAFAEFLLERGLQ